MSVLFQMRRTTRSPVHSREEIKKLIAVLIATDSALKQAAEVEKKLTNPAYIDFLLPVLVREYPPWQAADSVIRILHALKASDQASRFLVGKLKDRRPRIRAAAAATLESFANFHTAPELIAACKDRSVDVSIMAIHSLWVCSLAHPKLKKAVFDVCRQAVKHSSHGVRGAAFECLSHMKDARSKKLLALATADPHSQIRQLSESWLAESRQIKGGR